ncbi:hypothetical protein NIES2104_63890 [Leptolyngbya sp. NIES-2104]|nr:hypothetical protein NIES2104_63890 [Leptolyngbya sp. NIES-2104]
MSSNAVIAVCSMFGDRSLNQAILHCVQTAISPEDECFHRPPFCLVRCA